MMVRKWVAWLILATMFLTLALPAGQTAGAAGGIRIVLDGKTIASDAAPYIIPAANVTMVPLRIISEELGATVRWNQKEQQVTIQGGADKLIVMKRGGRFALVNDSRVDLDATVDLKAGRTMVPLRFVGETLGLNVNWNQKEQLITLTTEGNGEPSQPSSGADGDPASGGQPSEGNPGNLPGGDVPSGGDTPGKALRGVWVSTVYNLDWPSQGSYGKSLKQMEEFRQLLDDIQEIGMNAVFVQVRPASDALYPSLLVPWSKYLTGVQGLAPDYDPLAFMIDETHKRGMEFHAWFNPFRASVDAKIEQLTNGHVVKRQPEWIVNAGGKLYINPGIPEARQHIMNTIMEVVNGYNIDGVHLDDYFYPTNVEFADNHTFQAYNSDKVVSKADWRRGNINAFVRDLGAAIHAVKPKVRYGISPFGVWRNQSVDKTGSDTKAGVTTYDSMYADVRTWIRQGWVDYINPQIYWSMSFSAARYDKLVDWWVQEVKGTGVDLYIGHAPYKLGTKEAGWQSAQEIINQLKYNERYPEVKGDVFFSAKDIRKNPLGIKDALRSYYRSF
ncbi:family 10 glycosylhydrolase [Paenibacillus sp. GCM10012307]|uniref:Family 10 glycosylhydrolase n=1 Tax=Paenibacillus roseus TaxID=2798579 RepID=A0A934J9N7_9BACL|nr:family 10 glycosylhydrolase [Paenibacillus roseus]MBJ6362833.1 family 10 glycosylhydrolase [Paenibacillus roseus]